MARSAAQVAAQVAVEAIIDQFDAYDRETAAAVYANGAEQRVPALYLDMLGNLLGV